MNSKRKQWRKGKNPRSERLEAEEHDDPEIQAEIRKENTVNVLYDSKNKMRQWD